MVRPVCGSRCGSWEVSWSVSSALWARQGSVHSPWGTPFCQNELEQNLLSATETAPHSLSQTEHSSRIF